LEDAKRKMMGYCPKNVIEARATRLKKKRNAGPLIVKGIQNPRKLLGKENVKEECSGG